MGGGKGAHVCSEEDIVGWDESVLTWGIKVGAGGGWISEQAGLWLWLERSEKVMRRVRRTKKRQKIGGVWSAAHHCHQAEREPDGCRCLLVGGGGAGSSTC